LTRASTLQLPLRGRAARRDAPRDTPKLALSQAFALGLLHGPSELLPISSSAHTALVPWLAGWRYGELDPDLRKCFEVALHAGTAAALMVRPPTERSWGKPAFLIAASTPPALAGYTLGARVERRLGTPRTIAAGLLAGSVALAAGEMFARRGCPARVRAQPRGTPLSDGHNPRTARSAGWRDGLMLGLAQACALFPGVSRSGATIATARARGFSRLDADRLSWQTGLPVIAGATALKSLQLARRGVPAELRLPFAAGAAGSLLATLASSTLLTPSRRTHLLGACAFYRGVLALLVVRRMRDNTDPHAQPSKK
jgi:undecaprenyl-diphosphatase